MTTQVNETHDPKLSSWVDSANQPLGDFPIQNLPFGVFRRKGTRQAFRVGSAIGDQILDLWSAHHCGALAVDDRIAAAFFEDSLNGLMALSRGDLMTLRASVSRILQEGSRAARDVGRILVSRDDAEMALPAKVGDYTDFYASIDHAMGVGSLFRPDNPLLPNYKHIPIGYHGRSSSLVVSGTPVRRPLGQTMADGAAAPSFGPSRLLDYELEVGFFVGPGNPLGAPLSISESEGHIFGLCLVNDWSARDIQKWEYQPLGPFLGKNFATTLSPWVVTLEALAPYRIPAYQRPSEDPRPLGYLSAAANDRHGGLDLTVEAFLLTERMRTAALEPVRLSRSSFARMYWTPAQMLTHHASNGCNLRPGDLMASGTVSGPTEESRGCLLEITRAGQEPLRLPNGEQRRFLQDGDEVTFRGYCQAQGLPRIGFGECRGRILPAVQWAQDAEATP